MKTSLKSSLNVILSHKDYFDQRLLDIVSYLQSENNKLIVSLDMKKAQILKLNDDVLKLKKINAKLTYENHSLSLSKKESDKSVTDLEEALKKMQEELNRLTIENKKAIEEVNRQRKIQDELIKKIKKLENTNSTNSNMPSSMNILTHSIKPSNSRKESNHKRGGKIGHPVFRPHMSSCVDEIRNLYVKKAPSGSRVLKDKTGNILYYYSQEIDLLIKPKIIETRYYISEDGVEILNEEKKKYKISPVIYSNHFKSTMIYLNQRGTIPYERLSEMVKELSNNSINIKPSTMVKWSYDFS